MANKKIAPITTSIPRPWLSGVRPHLEPAGQETTPLPTLFVVVFGLPGGQEPVSVLGLGRLADDTIALAEADVVAALTSGAVPTTVGIAWVQDGVSHTESIAVAAYGPRVPPVGPDDQGMWALELSHPSTAPLFTPPPGSSTASAWCFLFPWLNMCQHN